MNDKFTDKTLNQCSTCIHWIKQPKFISASKHNEIRNFETGICVSGGFDAHEVKASVVCSLWYLNEPKKTTRLINSYSFFACGYP